MTPTPGYRRLAAATVLATFALIVVGGIVRVSDSGLGCGPAGSGFHGWPLCRGDVIPGFDLNEVIEYSHRALASVVALAMLALAIQAWRRYRQNRALVVATSAGFGLVVAQGLLGAVVVEENLREVLVASHLGLAMLLLAVSLFVWSAARPEGVGAPTSGTPALRRLTLAAQAATLATIVAGGYMAGTQHFGRTDAATTFGAHHACGKQFPGCNGEFMPFGASRLVDIHLTHRALMYLTTLLVLALVAVALRTRPGARAERAAKVALGLLATQVLLGALNVWLDVYELLIVAHLAVGTLLWGSLVAFALELHVVPEGVRRRSDMPADPRPVTA